MSQADFDQAAGKLMTELPQWGAEANALAADVNDKQVTATTAASSATDSATSASGSAATAESAKNQAGLYRDDAENFAAAAEFSKDQAAGIAAGITAASTSSVVMGNGSKTFTIPNNKQFFANQPVVATSGSNRMFGTVTSYSGATLVVNVTVTEGAGTFNSWTISPAGAQGATGGTAGGTLTDAINEKKGAAPASNATADIWGAGGNRVPITQTAAITGLPNAPQAGSKRTLVAVASFPVTSSAAFLVAGGSTIINVDDELDIVAETVSTFKVTVRRGSGISTVPTSFRNVELLLPSRVWIAPADGFYRVTLTAASGSGGAAASQSQGNAAASGAATGGRAIKTFFARAGSSYTLNLGAFGAGATANAPVGASSAVPGNPAIQSSFVGPGVSLICGGGGGGNAAVSIAGDAVAQGAIGGTATGGDFNYPGSPSGIATATAGGDKAAATGGGAVPYKGFACPSGNATAANQAAASGGAGVGGRSGHVTVATGGSSTAGGGGYAGASPDNSSTPGVGIGSYPPQLAIRLPVLDIEYAGTAGAASNSLGSSPGGGSGGGSSGAGQTAISGGSQALAGTGGAASYGTGATSGSVAYGGAASKNNSTGTVSQSGNGGAALAIIESV